jgi:hypothetical protein
MKLRGLTVIWLLVAAMLLSGCLGRATPGTPAPTAAIVAATATPAPQDTPTVAPVPDTPLPPATATQPAMVEASATPSPIPESPTPQPPATPDPDQGVGDVVFQDPLNGTSQWFWGFRDDVATFGITEGRLRAQMSQANTGWRFSISRDTVRVGNQQVRITANPSACAENDEYGLMFRAGVDDDGNYSMYLFRLRCGGGARFDLVAGTGMMTVVDWTASPAIQTGQGAENTLMVWMAGSQFRFYVNDQYLFSAQDASLAEGFYAVYVYDRTAGGLTVDFTDLVARSVPP